jgi:hypothetical protein
MPTQYQKVSVEEIDNGESLYSPPSMMIDRRRHIRLCMLIIIMMISQAGSDDIYTQPAGAEQYIVSPYP